MNNKDIFYSKFFQLIYFIFTGLDVNNVGEIPPPISCAPAVEVAVLTRWRPVLLIEPGWIFGWGRETMI